MKTTQERIDRMMERWGSGLDLTEDQKARLLPLVTAQQNEIGQVREQNKGKDKKDVRQAQIKEIRKKHRPNLRAVLNDEQKTKLKAMSKPAKENE